MLTLDMYKYLSINIPVSTGSMPSASSNVVEGPKGTLALIWFNPIGTHAI